MSKNKQKKEYASYNPSIIKKLKDKYGLTTQFINASLRGDRVSITSTRICEDYKLMKKAIDKAIENVDKNQ